VVIALSLLWNHALVLACRNRLRIVLLSVFYWKESRRERYRRAAGLLMHMEDAAFELIQVLRSGGAPARTLDDVAEAVLRMPEIVLMPPELAAREPSPDDPLLFYTGVGVEPRRDGAAFDWSRIDAGRTLVYCSLGGQTDLAPALSRSFFAAVIDAMATRDDLVAIVATGRRLTLTEPCDHVANVRVVGWAPQTEILSKARVMLTHGGLGSVQECVSMGVPMIVCPVGRDQFDMAELVTKHGMGLSIPAGQATAATLLPLVDRVLTGRAFAASVARMREAFRRSTLNEAVRVIEATLDGRLAPAARCETGST
jgi:MGT family glycosyltransferase